MIEMETAVLISLFSVAIGVGGFIVALVTLSHNKRRDNAQETAESVRLQTETMTKLNSISDDIKDIKADYRNMNSIIDGIRESFQKQIADLRVENATQFGQLMEKIVHAQETADAQKRRLDRAGIASDVIPHKEEI